MSFLNQDQTFSILIEKISYKRCTGLKSFFAQTMKLESCTLYFYTKPFCFILFTEQSKSSATYCAFRLNQPKGINGKMSVAENQGLGIVQDDGVTAKCDNENNYCFSYYTLDPVNKSKITVTIQGKIETVNIKPDKPPPFPPTHTHTKIQSLGGLCFRDFWQE